MERAPASALQSLNPATPLLLSRSPAAASSLPTDPSLLCRIVPSRSLLLAPEFFSSIRATGILTQAGMQVFHPQHPMRHRYPGAARRLDGPLAELAIDLYSPPGKCSPLEGHGCRIYIEYLDVKGLRRRAGLLARPPYGHRATYGPGMQFPITLYSPAPEESLPIPSDF